MPDPDLGERMRYLEDKVMKLEGRLTVSGVPSEDPTHRTVTSGTEVEDEPPSRFFQQGFPCTSYSKLFFR